MTSVDSVRCKRHRFVVCDVTILSRPSVVARPDACLCPQSPTGSQLIQGQTLVDVCVVNSRDSILEMRRMTCLSVFSSSTSLERALSTSLSFTFRWGQYFGQLEGGYDIIITLGEASVFLQFCPKPEPDPLPATY